MLLIAGDRIIESTTIEWIDIFEIEKLKITVHCKNESILVKDIQAIEIVMLLKPSAFENKRMAWARHAWMTHNLVGHPLMQFFSFFKMYKMAMWWHDVTVPRPLGIK